MAIDNDRESSIFFNILAGGAIFDILLIRIFFIFIDLIDIGTKLEHSKNELCLSNGVGVGWWKTKDQATKKTSKTMHRSHYSTV